MPSLQILKQFEIVKLLYAELDLNFFYLESFGKLNTKEELYAIIKNIKTKLANVDEIKDRLPDDLLRTFTTQYKNFHTWAKEMVAQINTNTISQQRTEIISRFTDHERDINKIWEKIAPYYIEFFIEKYDALQKQSTLTDEQKNQIAEDALKIQELRNTLESQSKQIEDRLKPTLEKGEILAQELIFFDSAKKYKKDSFFWMFVIVIVLISLIIFVSGLNKICLSFECFLENNNTINSNAEERESLFYFYLIKKISSQLFIISILVFVLSFSIKNFNATMHNRTVNLHKANAFAASLNLIGNVKDPNRSDDILNIAAREIFAAQKTGYLKKDGSDVNLTVLEKIASLFKSG